MAEALRIKAVIFLQNNGIYLEVHMTLTNQTINTDTEMRMNLVSLSGMETSQYKST
jgi:hypothetical protein